MAEIRKDIISGQYVIISPERSKRPHDFKFDYTKKAETKCPFCIGNEDMTPPELLAYRSSENDEENSSGWIIRDVPNLFSPLQKNDSSEEVKDGFIYKLPALGSAEVFIESPNHDLTFGRQPLEQVITIIKGLKERYTALKDDEDIKYIQIFKNFGLAGGASKEHGHWQIWSLPMVPPQVQNELNGSLAYYKSTHKCPYCDMIEQEINAKERVVFNANNFIALCPFASRFAYEIMILPKMHKSRFETISEQEIRDGAIILKSLIAKLEKGFNDAPYNIVLHTLPTNIDNEHFHWHIEILPRLTTFAGFEWGSGMLVNPTSPEFSAQVYREIDNKEG